MRRLDQERANTHQRALSPACSRGCPLRQCWDRTNPPWRRLCSQHCQRRHARTKRCHRPRIRSGKLTPEAISAPLWATERSRGARSAGVPSTTSCGRQPTRVWEPLRAASCSYLATSGSATEKGCVHFTAPRRSRSLAPRLISVPRARAAPLAVPRHPCQIVLSWARARRRRRIRTRENVEANTAPPIDTIRRNWEHSSR
jgi:hypothetical protein